MKKWKKFEIDCHEYLSKNFNCYADFILGGGSDANISDIFVKTKSGKEFYIEAKLCPAQCKQFVLIPDIATKTFKYSLLNEIEINKYSLKIIEYMNLYFDEFKEAGTKGKTIDFENSLQVFEKWIISAYRLKKVKYFITNKYKILPIEKFGEYFKVSAKYRVKRSGSNNVGKTYILPVKEYILNSNYAIKSIFLDKGKMFVFSDEDLNNKRFILDNYEFMFSLRGDKYEVRKLSNTFNANVIFSIDVKENCNFFSHEEFIRELI